MEYDPIARMEILVREVHETVHKNTERMHQRYPLLFVLLTTISVAALFRGLEISLSQIQVFELHPEYLVLAGLAGLFLTGGLYNKLGKDKFE